MRRFTAKNVGITGTLDQDIRTLLFKQGFGRTLEYLCSYSVFSVD